MTELLHCPFCRQAVDGLTLLFAGGSRVFVCPGCYDLLNLTRHQPYSHPMQRLRRMVGQFGEEVMPHEGTPGDHTAPCHGQATVAQGPAQHCAVCAAEPVFGCVCSTSVTED